MTWDDLPRSVRFAIWLFPQVRRSLNDSWRDGMWTGVALERGEVEGEPIPPFCATARLTGTTVRA